MNREMINRIAKAIVSATSENEKQLTWFIEQKADGTKCRMYHLCEVVNVFSKKQFHDMISSAYAAFRRSNAIFVEFTNLDDKRIDEMYYNLKYRDDGDTTIATNLPSARWKVEVNGYKFNGGIEMHFSFANGAMIPRLMFDLKNPLTGEYTQYKCFQSLKDKLEKVSKDLVLAEKWLKAYKIKDEHEEEQQEILLAPIPRKVPKPVAPVEAQEKFDKLMGDDDLPEKVAYDWK